MDFEILVAKYGDVPASQRRQARGRFGSERGELGRILRAKSACGVGHVPCYRGLETATGS